MLFFAHQQILQQLAAADVAVLKGRSGPSVPGGLRDVVLEADTTFWVKLVSL